jgi:hypothetical protein
MKTNTFTTRIIAALMIVMIALAAMPVTSAYATSVTYNFQQSNGITVAPGIITNDAFCGSYPTATTQTLMSTAAHGCSLERVTLSSVGTLLNAWYNTAYPVNTFVTGTSLQIQMREAQDDTEKQSWVAGFMLMYVNASGTITNFTGTEATQEVANGVNSSFTIDLSGQSATIPSGSKLGIRIRAVSGTSNAMRIYFGYIEGIPASGVLIVDEKQTTALAVSAATGTYGGTTNLSATLTNSAGLPISGKSIAFSLNGSSVGSATTDSSGVASLSGISLAGINAGNYPTGVAASFAGETAYVSSNGTGSLDVGQATPTCTISGYGPAAYDGAAHGASGTCIGVGGADLSSFINYGLSFTNIPGGTASWSFHDTSGNYSDDSGTSSIVITAKNVDVTADNKTIIFGGSEPTFTYTPNGFVGTDTFITTPTCSVPEVPHTAVDTYDIVCTGGTVGTNYNIVYHNGVFTVSAKVVLDVTSPSATITYGDAQSYTLTDANYSGFTGGDNAEDLDSPPTCSAGTDPLGVGSSPYTVICSGGSDDKYTFNYINTGTLTVDKAALDVTANDASKTYDGAAYSGGNGVGYSGFITGEDETVLSGTLTYGGTSQGAVNVNVANYTIIPSGLTSSNYDITFHDGTLTINPKPLTITANDASKAFGGTKTFAGTEFTTSAMVGSESVARVTLTSAGADASAIPGPYAIVPSDAVAEAGTDLGNYNITYATTGTLTVTADSNKNLSNLVLSTGAFTPAFSAGTTAYTQSVNSVTSLTVTPTVASTTATVTVNGNPVASGSASGAIALAPGENTIWIVVTAQDLSTKAYSVVVTLDTLTTITSTGSKDGWIRESSETSNKGGALNASASTIYIGDSATNSQYRAILSFDTSSIPDNAVITSVTLKFKYAGISGTLPFKTHGRLLADIRKGYFSTSSAIQLSDFNVAASKSSVLSYTSTKVSNWYSKALSSANFKYINLPTNITQFRLRFTKDDNNDHGADYLKIYSGSAGSTSRPQLIITWHLP